MPPRAPLCFVVVSDKQHGSLREYYYYAKILMYCLEHELMRLTNTIANCCQVDLCLPM
jgi:hypothetical protein